MSLSLPSAKKDTGKKIPLTRVGDLNVACCLFPTKKMRRRRRRGRKKPPSRRREGEKLHAITRIRPIWLRKGQTAKLGSVVFIRLNFKKVSNVYNCRLIVCLKFIIYNVNQNMIRLTDGNSYHHR